MSDESDEADGVDDLHRAQTTNIPASARGVTPRPISREAIQQRTPVGCRRAAIPFHDSPETGYL